MPMNNLGRRVYGLGAIVVGITLLILGKLAAIGQALPAGMPGQHILVYASAGLLILAGLAVNVRRTEAIGALALAGFFALWVLTLILPHALAHAMVWVSWEDVAERTAAALGGVLAYAQTSRDQPLGAGEIRGAAIARIARPMFGVCLVVFGISELVYSKFTASMVPAWLPPSQLVWTYVTGAAQIAAGLAILTTVRARFAAIMLTAMYLIFSLIVHLPRVIEFPGKPMSWSENGINIVLAGAAWVLVDSFSKAKPRH
jgi:uncharacterized membrane protein YphA (DoxX/SURF4 family)